MAPLANGRIVLWEGGSLWIMHVPASPGSRQRTDLHAHHAIQITCALGGVFQLHFGDTWLPGPVVVVPPDTPHAFEPKGLIAILFVEPESAAGRALLRAPGIDPARPSAPHIDVADLLAGLSQAHAEGDLSDDRLSRLGRELIARLAGEAQPPRPDLRVQQAIAWAADHLDSRLSITDAARQVGLSVGRMSHLFVEQTGLPFRTFLLWLRLKLAVERFAAGAPLTQAAHEAGFADSAHFSRTFRRMFGIAATDLRLV